MSNNTTLGSSDSNTSSSQDDLHAVNSTSSATSSAAKVNQFDKSIRGLFTVLKEVMEFKGKNELKLTSKVNPLFACLNRYTRVYNLEKGRSPDFSDNFIALYERYRVEILAGYKKDAWLRRGKISLQYGQGVEGVRQDIKIMLSAIYLTATELRDDTEKQLDGLPEEAYQDHQELIFPDVISLHLYRIFREVILDPEDKKSLSECIREIESELGVKSESDDGSGFGGLMKFATGMASKMGLQIPEGALPAEGDISKSLSGIFENEKTKNALTGIMDNLKGSSNLGDILSKLMQGFNDPALKQAIGDTLGPTMAGATNAIGSGIGPVGINSAGGGGGGNKGSNASGEGEIETVVSSSSSSNSTSAPKAATPLDDGEIEVV